MKYLMNFTTSYDDVQRYENADDLRCFFASHGCDGLELMPIEGHRHALIRPEYVKGVHLCCVDDWLDMERDTMIRHYRKDLDIAQELGAEYVVFHVSQVSLREALGDPILHTDEEVIDAASELINALLKDKDYTFWFLMENMWYPGLTFLRPEMTGRLLAGIRYEKKGFMFDTGHFMHTNLNLETQEEAIVYILEYLDKNREYLPYIKGIHLQQSLTGNYVKQFMENRPPIETDPEKLFCQAFTHIFKMDLHKPFTVSEIRRVVEKIQPEYLVYEYISESREMHAAYLKEGRAALGERNEKRY